MTVFSVASTHSVGDFAKRVLDPDAGGPFFMTPAVQWYYPGVETKVVARDEVAAIESSMGDQGRILFLEREW